MKVKAAVTWEKGKLSIEELDLADPTETQVLVKMVGSGVCHTDAVAIEQGVPWPLPAVAGHEGSGIVEKVGSKVTSVKPGDHIVMSYAYCGHCDVCKDGHPSQCETAFELTFFGKYPDGTTRLSKDGQPISTFFTQSSFATYAVCEEENVVLIEDQDVDLALLGPLGCGLETGIGTVINAINAQAGTSIVIFGAGAVGLSAIMGAKICGCINVIAVDVVPSRLELAKELGATHTLNGKEVDVVAEVMKITGKGAEYSIDTTASPICINQALDVLKSFGKAYSIATTGGNQIAITPQTSLLAGGRSLIGAIQGDSVPQKFIPKLVEFYKQGKYPIDKLIKFYKLEDIEQAFEDSKSGKTIKPVIRF